MKTNSPICAKPAPQWRTSASRTLQAITESMMDKNGAGQRPSDQTIPAVADNLSARFYREVAPVFPA